MLGGVSLGFGLSDTRLVGRCPVVEIKDWGFGCSLLMDTGFLVTTIYSPVTGSSKKKIGIGCTYSWPDPP